MLFGKDAAHSPYSRFEGAFKLRYLSVAFNWAWVYVSFDTPAVFQNRNGIGINADPSWLISTMVVAMTLFVAGIMLGKTDKTPPSWVSLLCGFAVATGTLISAAVASGLGPAVLVMASGILTGIGSGVLLVLWGQVLGKITREEAELVIPGTSIILLVCCLVCPSLPSPVGLLVAASFPIISACMLIASYDDLRKRKPGIVEELGNIPSSDASAVKKTYGRMCSLLFLAFFVLGCANAMQLPGEEPLAYFGIDIPMVTGTAIGVAIFILFVFFSARPTFDLLFRFIAILISCSLAFLPWNNLWTVTIWGILAAVADLMLPIATFLLVITALNSSVVNAAEGVGLTQGSTMLGILAGNIAGSSIQVLAGTSAATAVGTTLFLLVVFSFSWAFFPADRSSVLRASSRKYNPASQLDIDADELLIDTAIASLAERHGLTKREAEIAGYLARGHSQPFICDELVLSKNTVSTHAKHIYQKLGIHSRQELINLCRE